MARALLAQALDDADTDPRDVAALLDCIPGALDRAQEGLAQAKSTRTIGQRLRGRAGRVTMSTDEIMRLTRGEPDVPLKPVKGVPLPSQELSAMREMER